MCPKSISNADIVASYLDAVLRKDGAAVDRYFDPDVEYIVNGTSDREADKSLPPHFRRMSASIALVGSSPWSRAGKVIS
jgi:ketosteroid isomerase-like protein